MNLCKVLFKLGKTTSETACYDWALKKMLYQKQKYASGFKGKNMENVWSRTK